MLIDLNQLFKLLSDETRRRILSLLWSGGERCVCEIFFALSLSQPKVSRHLATMRQVKLLTVRREGTWVFYKINPDLPQPVLGLFENMFALESFQADQARLINPANPMCQKKIEA